MENQQMPNLELPQPVSNPDGLHIEDGAQGSPSNREKLATSEQTGNKPVVTSQSVNNAQGVVQPQSLVGATGSSAAQSALLNTTPAIADDVDLIEKEWVAKAREIVARTKADPYVQNKELNVFKADYMKKRYGKDVKVVSE
jgi:hypothetical protein